MRYLLFPVSILLYFFLAGCVAPTPQHPAYQFEPPSRQIDYLTDVEPILVKRCVVCHSCYNSPCQLKLSSWDGLERGASKESIYNGGRLKTMDPSRLLVDAHSEQEWRKKNFFSVLPEGEQSYDESAMYMLLEHKRVSPDVSGEYFPEASDLTCGESGTEIKKFLKKHPNRGMPFGFPPLKQEEFNTIAGWMIQGAHGPTAEQQEELKTISVKDQEMLNTWEDFLNNPAPKYRMTARYLYDHLFLAHITFETGSNEFFELVRSRTGSGEAIDIIATVRPYDDPGIETFYYRFRKIYSTIVHKTHMVFPLGKGQLSRINELFISPDWVEPPHIVSYNKTTSANPFETYEQIPIRSRYQWLLDNAHYTIMTFIRGPVCKGQIALNVINDHFWIMFLDPEYDLSVKHPGFIKLQSDNLRMPGENGSNNKLYKTLINNVHYKKATTYYKARQDFYAAIYPKGLGVEAIWKGNQPDDTPVLTVFRHFDSASVQKGVLGNLPNTLWVVDYPLFERIYYSLVAGFDVYGTAGHQLATRLYMDALRIEGESYFLDFLPEDLRRPMMSKWYTGINLEKTHYYPSPMPAATTFATVEPNREFIEKVVQDHIISKDIVFGLNYLEAGKSYPDIPTQYNSLDDIITGFIAVSAPGISFFRHVANHNANVAWIRITNVPERGDVVISSVIDRWHDNVRFLFREEHFLDPSKDRADFFPGFIGSYPNYFLIVDYNDLPDLFDILDTYDGSDALVKRLAKYGVNRADENFWEVYDWFQNAFTASDKKNSGLVDLNRYYYLAIE
ncbi:fatty acid cis/trans isomerase [Desulfopila sp. IMCC35008]|uniref:fatty acid cis/trans isomerase n=1 Tax=Desulfopila sp. IMCC35008 TaxID=2653858 RepID=UPI0013D6CB5D|nr:fatty acid cis/trans isomerase [Desulfopila sp. IMCC35008]